jgi:hypothetical protein
LTSSGEKEEAVPENNELHGGKLPKAAIDRIERKLHIQLGLYFYTKAHIFSKIDIKLSMIFETIDREIIDHRRL